MNTTKTEFARKRLAAAFIAPSRRNIWFGWLLLSAAVFLIQLNTLEIDPLINQNDVQIVDYGRTALNPSSDWSLTWGVRADAPLLAFSYLTPVMQELAYRITQPSDLGPRWLALLGAVFAATCALGWLMARNTPPLVALALASMFLVDPVFSYLYRGGRVDGWLFASAMGSCWLVRRATVRGRRGDPIGLPMFGAGVLFALTPFLWPSAPLLAPLVLAECFYFARSLKAHSDLGIGHGWGRSALHFSLGGLVALAGLLVPILWHLATYVESTKVILEVEHLHAANQLSIVDMFLVYDPLFFILMLTAIVVRRESWLLLGFGLALLLIYQTQVYLPRIIYFLPYFMAFIGFACSGVKTGRSGRAKQLTLNTLLILSLGWNVAQVLVIKPIVAASLMPANSPEPLTSGLSDAVGAGPWRVMLEAWPAYYAGRSLGWKMYLAGDLLSDEEYSHFISTMDFVLTREHSWFGLSDRRLKAAGFELKTVLRFSKPDAPAAGWWADLLSLPPTGYKPIKIYKKSPSAPDR